jgi:hypothetical protein
MGDHAATNHIRRSALLTLVLGVLGYTSPATAALLVACCYVRKHRRRKGEGEAAPAPEPGV